VSQLPLIQTMVKDLSLLQTRWKSLLDVLLGNQSLQTSILSNITLINGKNVINHKLGRKLIGWRIVRLRAAASLYDRQDSNQTPDLTLILMSNATVVADIEVF